jgi:hypothetical protein
VLAFLLIALAFFGYFSTTAFYGKGIFDFPTFVETAIDFGKSGIIYDRSSDYSPNLAIYKFPPLLAAILVSAYKSGVSKIGLFDIAYYLHIFLYCASVLILSMWAYSKKRNYKIFFILFSFGLLWYPLLDTNIIRLQLDVYVLFLLVVAFVFFDRSDFLASGFFIAIAFCLKIYPIILMGLLVSANWRKSVWGFLLGCCICLFFTICTLGVDENLFFWEKIFPTLLRELPAGGGDGNISLPTILAVHLLMPIYVCFCVGVTSLDQFTALLNAGYISTDEVMGYVSDVCWLLKCLTEVCAAGMVLISVHYFLRPMGHLDEGKSRSLLYAAYTAFIIVFMSNSWLNYQVVLLLPMLVMFSCFYESKYLSLIIRMVFYIVMFCWWIAASLDAAQERVNHFPQDTVPWFLFTLTEMTQGIGLSEVTQLTRCFSAFFLFVMAILLFWKKIEKEVL